MIDAKKIEAIRGWAHWHSDCRSDCPDWELARDLLALLVEREEMLSVLREVEWVSGEDSYGQGHVPPFCPICERREYEGHLPGCRLAALLKG